MTRRLARWLATLLGTLTLAACSSAIDGHAVSGGASGGSGGAKFSHGVVLGSGDVHVVDYADLGCPPCARLQPGLSKVISIELAKGGVQFTFFDLSFLDQHGPGYSTHAANALLCAADADRTKYLSYKEALFAQQPAEGAAGPSTAQFVAIAAKAGLTSAGFARCVRTSPFAAQVATVQAQAARDGVTSVPTVLVNGKPVLDPTADKVAQAIEAAR